MAAGDAPIGRLYVFAKCGPGLEADAVTATAVMNMEFDFEHCVLRIRGHLNTPQNLGGAQISVGSHIREFDLRSVNFIACDTTGGIFNFHISDVV